MIKAAFCDDDDTVLKELQSLLEEYRRERDYRIDAKVYHSPLDLLNEMEKGTRFDILFLDILMPGVDGIQTASEIRKFDNNFDIIIKLPRFGSLIIISKLFFLLLLRSLRCSLMR